MMKNSSLDNEMIEKKISRFIGDSNWHVKYEKYEASNQREMENNSLHRKLIHSSFLNIVYSCIYSALEIHLTSHDKLF